MWLRWTISLECHSGAVPRVHSPRNSTWPMSESLRTSEWQQDIFNDLKNIKHLCHKMKQELKFDDYQFRTYSSGNIQKYYDVQWKTLVQIRVLNTPELTSWNMVHNARPHIFSHIGAVLPRKTDFTLKMLCMHHIIPNRYIHPSGGFYSWVFAPDRGGNWTTKFCRCTYLTPHFMTV